MLYVGESMSEEGIFPMDDEGTPPKHPSAHVVKISFGVGTVRKCPVDRLRAIYQQQKQQRAEDRPAKVWYGGFGGGGLIFDKMESV